MLILEANNKDNLGGILNSAYFGIHNGLATGWHSGKANILLSHKFLQERIFKPLWWYIVKYGSSSSFIFCVGLIYIWKQHQLRNSFTWDNVISCYSKKKNHICLIMSIMSEAHVATAWMIFEAWLWGGQYPRHRAVCINAPRPHEIFAKKIICCEWVKDMPLVCDLSAPQEPQQIKFWFRG